MEPDSLSSHFKDGWRSVSNPDLLLVAVVRAHEALAGTHPMVGSDVFMNDEYFACHAAPLVLAEWSRLACADPSLSPWKVSHLIRTWVDWRKWDKAKRKDMSERINRTYPRAAD